MERAVSTSPASARYTCSRWWVQSCTLSCGSWCSGFGTWELPDGWDCWKEDQQVRTKALWPSVARTIEERTGCFTYCRVCCRVPQGRGAAWLMYLSPDKVLSVCQDHLGLSEHTALASYLWVSCCNLLSADHVLSCLVLLCLVLFCFVLRRISLCSSGRSQTHSLSLLNNVIRGIR